MLPSTRFARFPAGVRRAPGGITRPAGFVAAGVASGVKRRGKLDLGILYSEVPSVSSVVFTGNAAAAAPVQVTRATCDCSRLRAVVVNSGNANACTGEQGTADAARMRLLAANGLDLPVEQVAVASTGLIGEPLEMPKIEAGVEAGLRSLSRRASTYFANAIRTTDRHAKHGALEVRLDQGIVTLGLAAKGSGMINPDMATMLCFVTCDAVVAHDAWDGMIRAAVAETFNRITVDGQESTNDMVLGLCNGASGIAPDSAGLKLLADAVAAALLSLAVSIVADGEGTTTTRRLTVCGARDARQARAVARNVADSPLVKTAFYGRDANWGRILQSVGQALGRDGGSGLPARISYEELVLAENGRPRQLSADDRDRLLEIMNQSEISLEVVLSGGTAQDAVYFSDLSHDYVTLNAEYTT